MVLRIFQWLPAAHWIQASSSLGPHTFPGSVLQKQQPSSLASNQNLSRLLGSRIMFQYPGHETPSRLPGWVRFEDPLIMVMCCCICQSLGYMFAWFLWEGAWGVPCFSSPTRFELCKILVFVVSKCWAQLLVPHRAPNIFLLVNEKHTQKINKTKSGTWYRFQFHSVVSC